MKKNPPSFWFQVGERVCHYVHGVGSVVETNMWIWLKHQDEVPAVSVLFDKYTEPRSESVYSLKRVSPMEELAAVLKKNPLAKYVVGDLVRVRNSWYPAQPLNKQRVAVVEQQITQTGYRVRFLDGEKPQFRDTLAEYMEHLTPLEQLATVPTKKNPERFETGTRFRLRGYRENLFGTVVSCVGTTCVAEFDITPGRTNRVHIAEVIPITPLEELAHSGKPEDKAVEVKAWMSKGKKNPVAPFRPGDRVLYTLTGKVGMVAAVAVPAAQIVWVRFDANESKDVSVATSHLQHISPLEELALIGKQAKPNHSRPQPFAKGDRVRFNVRKVSYSNMIGTVESVRWDNGSWDYLVHVLYDNGKTLYYSPDRLEKVSPLEDLASAAKKNPSFSVGDRVTYARQSFKGTVVHKGTDSYGVWHWDGKETTTQRFRSGALLELSPMEALAELGKAVKNPKERLFEIGDRVRFKSDRDVRGIYAGRVGTVLQYRDREQESIWGRPILNVVFDGISAPRAVGEEGIEKVSPLEDLALAAKALKNPASFQKGDRVVYDWDTTLDRIGTVLGFDKSLIYIKFDDGGTVKQRYSAMFRHVTPLEELAAVGKK